MYAINLVLSNRALTFYVAEETVKDSLLRYLRQGNSVRVTTYNLSEPASTPVTFDIYDTPVFTQVTQIPSDLFARDYEGESTVSRVEILSHVEDSMSREEVAGLYVEPFSSGRDVSVAPRSITWQDSWGGGSGVADVPDTYETATQGR